MKKQLTWIFCCLAFLCFVMSSQNVVKADTDEGEIVRGPACPIDQFYSAQSTSYEDPVSVKTYKATNNTGTTQLMTVSCTREIYFEGSISGTADANMIFTSIGVRAETRFGSSYTDSFSVDTYVPAHQTYYCDIGSLSTSTNGSIVTVESDCHRSYRSVYANFTTGQYVEWHK